MISQKLFYEIAATSVACQDAIYREDSSALHDDLTRQMYSWVKERVEKKGADRIIDVGCGMGPALDLFAADWASVVGITKNPEEAEACRAKGHAIITDDMHEALVLIDPGSVDGIWLRHAAEHSFMPLVLLRLCRRALRPGGWLYLEVPAPDTACRHTDNVNHYSVFTKSGWASLLGKAGFTSHEWVGIKFAVQAGEDMYHGFLAK